MGRPRRSGRRPSVALDGRRVVARYVVDGVGLVRTIWMAHGSCTTVRPLCRGRRGGPGRSAGGGAPGPARDEPGSPRGPAPGRRRPRERAADPRPGGHDQRRGPLGHRHPVGRRDRPWPRSTSRTCGRRSASTPWSRPDSAFTLILTADEGEPLDGETALAAAEARDRELLARSPGSRTVICSRAGSCWAPMRSSSGATSPASRTAGRSSPATRGSTTGAATR